MLFLVNTVCVTVACVSSLIGILTHLKNYRKPMDQRLIVRILIMVPLFSVSAYLTLYSRYRFPVEVLEFVREMYEAVVIYTFYTLLTNLLGGEREIIYHSTGKAPVKFLFTRLDISDPETFWIIKRLVMQYVYMRPLVTLLMAINQSTVLKWILIIIYNVSITLALNALMAFWVCLRPELEPYRVVLKFLSVKLIVFFSYWQSLALSIAHSFGLLSAQSLVVWNCSLMCWETVLFAYVHWKAFPASDYHATFMFGFARLRIDAAVRDVVGIVDVVCDFRSTFMKPHYGHRNFDSVEAVLDHPDSNTRAKRLQAGLRYKNGGRSKYWLPNSSLSKLLGEAQYDVERTGGRSQASYGSTLVGSTNSDRDHDTHSSRMNHPQERDYPSQNDREDQIPECEPSDDEEAAYELARQVYGDYNYPVATVRESEEYVSFEDRLRRSQVLERI